MKIHIIGASGFGKTYLAEKLADMYGISVNSLDDLFWDNSRGSYNIKRDAEERNAMLERVLKRDAWIIEGVHTHGAINALRQPTSYTCWIHPVPFAVYALSAGS